MNKKLIKFLSLLTVLVSYFSYVSYHYGIETGWVVTAITWSFFVLCTPIADGGFLIDFPVRFLFNVKMLHTEIFVWVLAITISSLTFWLHPQYFEVNVLTKIFYQILSHPWPFWSVILLSLIGTFASIVLADNIYDAFIFKDGLKLQKKKIVLMAVIFGLTFYVYHQILLSLGINITG